MSTLKMNFHACMTDLVRLVETLKIECSSLPMTVHDRVFCILLHLRNALKNTVIFIRPLMFAFITSIIHSIVTSQQSLTDFQCLKH